MPVRATFHNTIFDIRCSKCKRTQDPIYFTQHGKVYKTCNECRDRARTRRGLQLRNSLSPAFLAHLARPHIPMEVRQIPDSDTDDDVVAVNPVDSLIALGFNYTDTDMAAVLLLSSSAAAAPSSSSSAYFVDEPDPEPEPEGP